MYNHTAQTRTPVKDHAVEDQVKHLMGDAWKTIAPFWPLSHLVCINPLHGFEDMDIEQALITANALFQYSDFPLAMSAINRQTIKWLQAFFDGGQATLNMPMRHLGLYESWKKMVWFDDLIHCGDTAHKKWLKTLPESAPEAIIQVLSELNIAEQEQPLFLTLMLTTLPGWAAHIQYRAYANTGQASLKMDYLAIRLIMTRLMWDKAVPDLLKWHTQCLENARRKTSPLEEMTRHESKYIQNLLQSLDLKTTGPNSAGIDGTGGDSWNHKSAAHAQLVFCIDVRSEPIRGLLEKQGPYETYGFSGFFGLPIGIHNTITGQTFASCPALLKPKYYVDESPGSKELCLRDTVGYRRLSIFKKAYQSLKYNIGTAFALVECFGVFAGLWMALKTILPVRSVQVREKLSHWFRPKVDLIPSIQTIPLADQCYYAEFALRTMGLIKDFAPVLVLCGHGSTTENNAYASILHCGACGGHHGIHNAKVLAMILNSPKVRSHLASVGIIIPDTTCCIAAEHNTTTDIVEICESSLSDHFKASDLKHSIETLKQDLIHVGIANSQRRCKALGFDGNALACANETQKRSNDWSQIRPEWGLAGNACFIIGRRSLSEHVNLEGRAFLHSYDYRNDQDGSILTGILTAPMVVTQWINNQYLFSTLDPISYGSGSKITKNITGKIGVMQGVASDLMTGLPLQSVYSTDTTPYHQAVRLNVVVHAPIAILDSILSVQPVLQKLFGHGWILLTCIDPDHRAHFLNRDFTWRDAVVDSTR